MERRFINYTLCCVLVGLFYQNLMAQQGLPVNSNYLIERGISPRVLDAAADFLLQEGSFVQHLNLEIASAENTRSYTIGIIYDPDYRYGKDIRFVIDPSRFNKSEIRDIKNTIGKSHQYSRLSRYYLYDETTLKLIKEDENEAILEYLYQRTDLEPGLKKVKKYKGQIFIRGNELDRVVITAVKPLSNRISNYEKTVYFSRIPSKGGHIVSHAREKYTVSEGRQPSHYSFDYSTTQYKNASGEELTWESDFPIPPVQNTLQTDTVNSTLGGFFPILGKPATKLGYGLPKPYGIGVARHIQTTNLQFTDLQVGTNGELISLKDLFDLNSSSLDQPVSSWMIRGDLWVFPFLNVSMLVGRADAQVKGEIVLDQELRETLTDLAPFLGMDPDEIPSGLPLDIDVTVNTVGFGATLGGAIGEDFVLTLNYQFLIASTPEANTATNTHVVMPLAGYSLPLGIQLLAGVQGQFYDSNIVGFFLQENGDTFNYAVNFEPRKWNAIVGGYVGIGKHIDLSLNFGFGERTSTTATLGFRF